MPDTRDDTISTAGRQREHRMRQYHTRFTDGDGPLVDSGVILSELLAGPVEGAALGALRRALGRSHGPRSTGTARTSVGVWAARAQGVATGVARIVLLLHVRHDRLIPQAHVAAVVVVCVEELVAVVRQLLEGGVGEAGAGLEVVGWRLRFEK